MAAREAPAEMLPSSTGQIKMHGASLGGLPFCLCCRRRRGYENPSLRLLEATDNHVGMSNPITHLVVVAAAFLLAGLVKGVTGLALPTVGVGLLSLAMPPAHAAALIVVPALITNLWQMMSGPGLWSLVRRLWPMQLAICLGTWASASLMAGSETAFASAALGIALIAYAAFGLMNVRFPHVPAWAEWWLGTFVGGATGFITAAAGVFVIPAVPYLQALCFEREEFVQALGLSFTVSAIALAWSLVSAGTLNLGTGLYSLLALVPALAGMIAGQHLLRVMRSAARQPGCARRA
jgi:hypothetical protein